MDLILFTLATIIGIIIISTIPIWFLEDNKLLYIIIVSICILTDIWVYKAVKTYTNETITYYEINNENGKYYYIRDTKKIIMKETGIDKENMYIEIRVTNSGWNKCIYISKKEDIQIIKKAPE